jgi:hypothetical protein
MKKQTGIWLDAREAHFIELEDGDVISVRKVGSDFAKAAAKGGHAGGRLRGGAPVGISEKALHNSRRNAERNYYEAILDNLHDADEVLVFGPGEAKDKLVNAIKAHPSHFNADLMAVLTADDMTEPQKIAYVKTFFEAN